MTEIKNKCFSEWFYRTPTEEEDRLPNEFELNKITHLRDNGDKDPKMFIDRIATSSSTNISL